MKRATAMCVIFGILYAQSAAAMILNPRGTGQVLLFPYFTVNKHQQTLVSVTNTTSHAKALQVRFREGYNGRDVLDFHVYLSAYDTWTAAVFSLADAELSGSGAAILVEDTSCTAPNIATVSPRLPDGRPYQPFLSYAYSGINADSGPADDTRTREGFIEVIEMAEVTGDTRTAITPVSGVPANCGALQLVGLVADLAVPGGGLTGAEAVVDVAQGTLFSANAYAIDGFTNRTLYYPPGNIHPHLGDASTSANGFVSASVPIGGGYMQLDYPPAQAIDAVSALLMAAEIFTEWDNTPSAGAQTDVAITFPTKHYYTDRALTQVIAPFSERFGSSVAGRSYVRYQSSLFDRAGAVLGTFPMPCGWECPPTPPLAFPYETQVLAFPRVPGSEPSDVLGSRLSNTMWLGYESVIHAGMATIDAIAPDGHQLRPDAHGTIVRGLPVAGFTATNYINANAAPGVLANYSGANALLTSLPCDALLVSAGVSNPCNTQ